MEPRSIRVVHYGLGEIGSRIARLTARQRGLVLVGGIDRDPAKVGRDLGEVIGLDHPLGVVVSGDTTQVLRQTRPDIVIHATTSFFHEVYSQIAECVQAHAHVLSTCEELVYPYAKEPAACAALHRLAKQAGVTVLGAGCNPGFVMDLLPLMLTAPCVDVRYIGVRRIVDAAQRRASLQQRIGAGLTTAQFHEHLLRGAARHIGLPESVSMLADGLGWRLDDVSEAIEPIIASEWCHSRYVSVAPGQVAGIQQIARGWMHGREVITLTWQTAIGAQGTHDAIHIDGTPPIDLVIQGGLHGDLAAAALILHTIPRVLAAPPGLLTVLDLQSLHYEPRPEPHLAWARTVGR